MLRRRRLWLPAAVACLLVIGGLVVIARATPVSSELEQAVAAAEARMAARAQREAAWGETHDGSAFATYAAALHTMPIRVPVCWDPEHREWVTGSGERLVVPPQEVLELRAAWQSSLQLLVEGAHRRDATPLRFGEGVRLEGWQIEAEIQLRLQEGRRNEAVQLWLDGATFWLDCRVWFDIPPLADWSDVDLRRLGSEAGGALAAGLLRLESRLRVPLDVGGILATLARPLLDGDYGFADWSWAEVGSSWRWGFDPSARHREAFAELYKATAALERAGSQRTGHELAEWWQRLRLPDWVERSFLIHIARQRAQSEVQAWFRLLTELRLLRLALSFHLRQPLPELLDPFSGAPFQAAIDGDTAELRGPDGAHPPARRVVRR